ncbi:hypothetical protein [Clostridioides difficile]|uniref:Uncharacterized protein n=2 Tax=Clostridioides difficile TaxID=1496 RepID=A0AB74QGS2_CLODI|nr:hypothetical protein [Clostridioides difficile]EGT3815259.1 hypothetical protein [Clostridioides difficile]EGT4202966.1 hypothetical protein [Clostridioides difficile]EJX3465511.1 hypothetical protein [Clostridioides difficile]ELX4570407.1 hypothetical protein [Clostridioides difficile]EQJ94821.1 hypothetical protein QUA_0976 [Clostridioides difficile P49]
MEVYIISETFGNSSNESNIIGIASSKQELNKCIIKMKKENLINTNLEINLNSNINIETLNKNIDFINIEKVELNIFNC